MPTCAGNLFGVYKGAPIPPCELDTPVRPRRRTGARPHPDTRPDLRDAGRAIERDGAHGQPESQCGTESHLTEHVIIPLPAFVC
jgi:hypothetical protein